MKTLSLAYVVLMLTYFVNVNNVAYGQTEDGVWKAVNKNSRGTVKNPMGFQQWLPNDYSASGSTTYKLIVFLHGSGQRGNGSTELGKVLEQGLPKQITTLGWNGQTGSTKWIILCPQQSLSYNGWVGNPSDPTSNDGIEFINWVKNYSGLRVDWNNGIYVTGLSMGAPWSLVGYAGANYPSNYFAAMSAYSGGAGKDIGTTIGSRDIPVWALMGGNDNTVSNGSPVRKSMTETINAIISQNPSTPPIYDLNVGDYDHNSIFWDYCYDWKHDSYTPNLYEWFLTKTLSAPGNQPPHVDAGPDKILTLPNNATTLNGTATDSDGTIASYQWTQVAGQTATLSGQGSPNLTASNLLVGTYTFRLTVTDNLGASSFNEALVSVVQEAPPNSPSNLTALPTSSSTINLSWVDNSSNETGFNVERSLTSQTGYTQITIRPAGSTSFSDTGLASNTTYFYRVSAVNGAVQSSYSNESSATTNADTPVGNGALTWTNIIGSSVDAFGTLTKTAAYGSAAGASSLEVLPAGQDGWVQTKVTQTGKTRTIGLSAADTDATVASIGYAITFSDNNRGVFVYEGGTGGWVRQFTPGEVYRIERQGSTISYKVVGESLPFRTSSIPSTTSLVVDASLLHTGAVITETTISFTPPISPSNLAALPASSSTINLSWIDNSNNETGFKVERSSTSQTGYTQITIQPAGSTSFSDTGLASNTTYFYRVSAVNGLVQSSYSNESSATTNQDTPVGNSTPTWTNVVGASVDGVGTLTKTAAYGSAAGASSLEVLPAGQDGWVQTKVTQTGKTRTIGLSAADTDATVASIGYAITFSDNNRGVFVYEGGTGGWVRQFTPGEVYRIERQGSTIFYKVVGESLPFRTSSIPSTTSLVVDASLLHTGAQITETTISFGSHGASSARVAIIEPQVIGNDETDKASFFSLYPNPANSILKISFDEKTEGSVQIRIIDSSGKTEWEGSRVGELEIEIDLNSLNISSGIKVVSILKSDGKIINKRLQKLR